ncbi:stage II sporulation protein R [Bacillus haikouensis]|jgi:stage II sporulation protein R|uniref:stage II sporulation protein R n=1 Tax=Bacillus haikouensis TaxID=1510468 RepID=UPI0015582014|nr:stage II sporulation protein R [Bacillus haikouensis]NQD68464.1 stage II sporulation protein R [Bacillus haikouensis]
MKTKHTVLSYILILTLGTILSLYIPKQESIAQEPMVIPEEAIRLRILANSDLEKDQNVKRLVRDEVNKEITEWVGSLTSQEEAKNIIKTGLPELQKIAEDVVAAQGLDQRVQIDFGKVEFPTKLYGQYLYPAGEYEAVLITLGKGEGANWWCVLYPPLCFLDFSTGNAVRSPGFETTVEASGEVVTEVDVEDEAAAAAETVAAESEAVEDEMNAETVEVPSAVEESEREEESEARSVKETKLMEDFQRNEEMEVNEQPVQEQVFVEEGEQEEVEVRFFVVDLVKGLFK